MSEDENNNSPPRNNSITDGKMSLNYAYDEIPLKWEKIEIMSRLLSLPAITIRNDVYDDEIIGIIFSDASLILNEVKGMLEVPYAEIGAHFQQKLF